MCQPMSAGRTSNTHKRDLKALKLVKFITQSSKNEAKLKTSFRIFLCKFAYFLTTPTLVGERYLGSYNLNLETNTKFKKNRHKVYVAKINHNFIRIKSQN